MKTEIARRSRAIPTQSDYFPTALQRSTFCETVAELMTILRREADDSGFVITDVPTWARRLHGWPEAIGNTAKREKFVRELTRALVRFGALKDNEKIFDGQHIRGYFVAAARTVEPRHRLDPSGVNLTAADLEFLKCCGIVAHEPVTA